MLEGRNSFCRVAEVAPLASTLKVCPSFSYLSTSLASPLGKNGADPPNLPLFVTAVEKTINVKWLFVLLGQNVPCLYFGESSESPLVYWSLRLVPCQPKPKPCS